MIEAIAFFAALGVGSITAALIGRSVAIAGHRQNWINGLRDDIALFFKELSSGRFDFFDDEDTVSTEEHEIRVKSARMAALLVYYRILLRLNMSEELHRNLGDQLETLLLLGNTDIDKSMMSNSVEAAQRILKREWAVTKYTSFLAPKVASWRGQKW